MRDSGTPARSVWTRLAGDDLSAGRRAEAYGVLVFLLVAEWARISGLWPPLVRLILDGSPDAVTILQDGYKLAGIFSLAWSAVSFLHRRTEGPPTSDQIQQLRAADRTTLKKTGLLTAVWAVFEFGRFSLASSGDEATSIWVPIFCGGMCLLVRGRWSHRRTGTTLAAVLLAVSAAVLVLSLVVGF